MPNGEIRWLDPSYGVEYTGDSDDARLLSFQSLSLYGFFDPTATAPDIELLLQLDVNRDGRISADDDLDPNPDDDDDLETLYYWLVRRASRSEIQGGLRYRFGDLFNGALN